MAIPIHQCIQCLRKNTKVEYPTCQRGYISHVPDSDKLRISICPNCEEQLAYIMHHSIMFIVLNDNFTLDKQYIYCILAVNKKALPISFVTDNADIQPIEKINVYEIVKLIKRQRSIRPHLSPYLDKVLQVLYSTFEELQLCQ